MKTTQECWQALIDGEKIIDAHGTIVELIDGTPIVSGRKDRAKLGFFHPEDWSIYTHPKWYDNIPEGGVLCWVSDRDPLPGSGNCFAMILKHSAEQGFTTKIGTVWKHATPLPKQEIQQLLDNAPDGEDE